MSFKIADGYVEVHAKANRANINREAKKAADAVEEEGRKREGSLLLWLFKSNPKLHKALEAPIGTIFSRPAMLAIAAAAIFSLAGFAATALSTAILSGIAGGFIAGGIWLHANDERVVGAYKTMREKIKSTFYEASKPIVGPLIGAMGMIGDKVKEWQPAFTRIYEALAPLIEPFTGGILGFIEAMLPGIERAMPGIETVMLALADHMPGLGTSIGDFFATIAENEPLLRDVVGLMITWMENFFKVAGPVLVFFMMSFAGLAIEWKFLMDALKAGWKWVDETWHAIPGWWDETWGAVKGWFKDLGNDITGFFTDSSNSISTWWNNQIGQITGWWGSTWGQVSTWFSELPGEIGGFLASLPGTISGWFGQAFDAVTYGFGYAVGTWVRFMVDLPGRIVGALVAGWTLVTGWFDTAMTWITDRFLQAADWIVDQAQTLPARIGRFFQEMGTAVVRWVADMVNRVTDWFGRLPGRLWRAANDAWNGVIGVFRWAVSEGPRIVGDMVNRVVSAVTGLAGRLYNAGRDAIIGLVNGIQSLMGWAVDAAWRAARNIAGGFMDALGIGSPSKYFRDEVGKWIPAGIMVGVEDNMGDLDRFANGFPDELASGMRPPLAGNQTTTDNSTNYSGIKVEVHVDNLQELEDIKKFLDGRMKSDPKARTWSGNLYEQQGEYVRSYQ